MGPPYLAQIATFSGDFEPRGWLNCDGKLLPISEFDTLFMLIGTKYGGDGTTTFALPSLPDPIPGVKYVMAVEGMMPPSKERPWVPDVMGFALQWKAEPPRETVRATGQLLPIQPNTALFSILGNKFGGSKDAGTFALPNLGGDWIFCIAGVVPPRA